MNSLVEKIRLLEVELNNIQFKQTSFKREIDKLSNEIHILKQELTTISQSETNFIPINPLEKIEKSNAETLQTNLTDKESSKPTKIDERNENLKQFWENRNTTSSAKKENTIQKDLEKFIGENLISKIGIGILLLGVGVGLKYYIDHAIKFSGGTPVYYVGYAVLVTVAAIFLTTLKH